jgi:hypothetical protein
MIELTDIKATDTVGQLRRQINSVQKEIMHNQPMIGACVNPSVYLFNNKTLVYQLPSQNVTNYLNAVILPKRKTDECFVVGLTGQIHFLIPANEAAIVNKILINIQEISGIISADMSFSYRKFTTPDSLGLNHKVDGQEYLMYQICRHTHITKEGQETVPTYMANITTSHTPSTQLGIELIFDKGNLDFTNGADEYIAF